MLLSGRCKRGKRHPNVLISMGVELSAPEEGDDRINDYQGDLAVPSKLNQQRDVIRELERSRGTFLGELREVDVRQIRASCLEPGHQSCGKLIFGRRVDDRTGLILEIAGQLAPGYVSSDPERQGALPEALPSRQDG